MIKVSANQQTYLAEDVDFNETYIEINDASEFKNGLEASMIERKKLDNLDELSDLKFSTGTSVREIPFTPQEEMEIVAIDSKLEYIATHEGALLSNFVLDSCYKGKD